MSLILLMLIIRSTLIPEISNYEKSESYKNMNLKLSFTVLGRNHSSKYLEKDSKQNSPFPDSHLLLLYLQNSL